ncbi:disintegrin and metalloproteinase domain-containing protein 22 isoform X1 [Tachysurus ichikawai]
MMASRLGLWLVCVCGALRISARHSTNGVVLDKTRALRDESRFLGKESTVPVRLVYRADQRQTAHDVLSTRVRTDQKNHLAQATFQVKAFDRTFILDTELNQ